MNNLSRVQKKKKPTKLSGFILFAKELQGKEVKGNLNQKFKIFRKSQK